MEKVKGLFIILLANTDLKRFAFLVPMFNNSQPLERFHWKVLPQGLSNSPTICQHFVHQVIQPVRNLFPQSVIYCYMDDILITACENISQDILTKTASFLNNSVASAGLIIAPEKIQHSEPWKYLGCILFNRTIRPQVLQINPPKDLTLNRLQQLLGAINWVPPSLGIPIQQ